MEEWRDIAGWEGEYQVSNLGRIRSFKRTPLGEYLNPSPDAYGYLQFSCKRTRKLEKKFKVHRVVWMAFNGFIPDYLDVDHINTDKKDNRLSNLECVTKQENHRRATLSGLKAHGEQSGTSKLSERDVIAIFSDKSSTNIALATIYGICAANVSMIRTGKTWKWLTKSLASN